MTRLSRLKRLFFSFTNNRQSKKYKHGEIRQVSIKDIHEAKKSLEEAGGINYIGTNKNKNKSRSVTEEKYRHDIIASLHEGIDIFKDDEFKKASIESFAKSKMSIEEIKTHLDQVRELHLNSNNRIHGSVQRERETKLPQKNLPDHIR
jgi:uncharacterized NAD-dependent epimerase/dehydratase family protein